MELEGVQIHSGFSMDKLPKCGLEGFNIQVQDLFETLKLEIEPTSASATFWKHMFNTFELKQTPNMLNPVHV